MKIEKKYFLEVAKGFWRLNIIFISFNQGLESVVFLLYQLLEQQLIKTVLTSKILGFLQRTRIQQVCLIPSKNVHVVRNSQNLGPDHNHINFVKLVRKVYFIFLFCFIDVCSLRLDFETLTILGPATTGEAPTTGATAPGHGCQDSFMVTVRNYYYLFQKDKPAKKN